MTYCSRDDLAVNLTALRAGEMHVWLSFAETRQVTETICREILSDEEQKRAEKIRLAANQTEFILAHALVRAVLSQYHPAIPNAWEFNRAPLGKPFICAPADAPSLQFSLSHTRGLAACAVALNPIGVDVERLEAHDDLLETARQFFSPTTMRELENTSDEKRTLRFYEEWTRMEACSKVSGAGLTLSALSDTKTDDYKCVQSHVSPEHILAAAVRNGQGSGTIFKLRKVCWRIRADTIFLETVAAETEISPTLRPHIMK